MSEATWPQELRWRLRYEWPRRFAAGLAAFWFALRAFPRWAWLRLTGKTAYRFAPMYESKFLPDGSLQQANGLRLPRRMPESTFDDVRADMAAAWEALKGKE